MMQKALYRNHSTVQNLILQLKRTMLTGLETSSSHGKFQIKKSSRQDAAGKPYFRRRCTRRLMFLLCSSSWPRKSWLQMNIQMKNCLRRRKLPKRSSKSGTVVARSRWVLTTVKPGPFFEPNLNTSTIFLSRESDVLRFCTGWADASCCLELTT